MKIFNKAKLSLAVTLGVLSLGLSTVATADQMTSIAGGAIPAGTVNPMLSGDGTGQVLVFPYYNVRNGNKSFFNITNTSNETLVVKVRFREHHNSRDTLDFNLALSPFDVWTGWVEDSATGPVFKTNDTSCTVPAIPAAGAPFNAFGYTGASDDNGSNSIDRSREGYMEVIAMGRTNTVTNSFNPITNAPLNMASAIKHVNGTPRNCATFQTASTGTVLTGTVTPTQVKTAAGQGINGLPAVANAALGFNDFVGLGASSIAQAATGTRLAHGAYAPINPLKGNFSLINADNGVGAGTEAVAINNFFMTDTATSTGVDPAEGHLITAQTYPYFLEPTLASRQGLWNVDGLAVLESAFTSTNVMNEWAKNADTGAATDWVVSFPTKSFHADFFCNQIQAGKSQYRTSFGVVAGQTETGVTGATGTANTNCLATSPSPLNFATLAPFSNHFNESVLNADNGTAVVPVSYLQYNREEGGAAASGATFSPAPPGAVKGLEYEANVITIGAAIGDSNLGSLNPSLLDAPLALSASNGWINATLTSTAYGANPTGLPVMGFIFKTRNQGDATKAYGQMMGHAYQ